MDDTQTEQTVQPTPVTIIGPVGQTVYIAGRAIVMMPCPYGPPGPRCYHCPLVADRPCLVRAMVDSDDEETRATVARLLGGSA